MTITGVRTRGAVDETEPVELIDDEWSHAAPVTPARSRRRWPEAVLVVAVVAVVLGIGATGGDDEGATDMPRRTTTTVGRTTSTTPRPTSTTTTWPASLAGTGPVLGAGAAPTSTALVVAEEGGTVAVLDLDTGDVCRARGGRDSWFPSPQPGVRDELIVMDGNGRSLTIDRDCTLEPANRGDPWSIRAITATTYWTTDDGPVQRLVEHDAEYGRVLRRIDVPGAGNIVADDAWIVVAAAGEMVAIDLHSDRQVALGSGQPLGIGGGQLFAIRCQALACSAIAIDVASARVRVLDLPLPTMWEPASVSLDGRWAQYSVMSELGRVDHVLADLRDGTMRDVGRGGPCSFTAESRWLICVRPSVIEAVSIDTGDIVDLSDLFDRPTNGFATMSVGAS